MCPQHPFFQVGSHGVLEKLTPPSSMGGKCHLEYANYISSPWQLGG